MRKELKQRLLQAVKSQLQSEINTDWNDIDLLLEDPSIATYDKEKGIAYAIHEKLHHLAIHEKALELLESRIKAPDQLNHNYRTVNISDFYNGFDEPDITL